MYTVRTCVTNRIQPHSHTYHIHRQPTWAHTNTHTSYTDRHMSNIQHHHDLSNDMCGNAPTLTANTTLSLTAPPTCNSAECGFLSCDCHLSLYMLILCHAIYSCISMNVFSVSQAVNTALSFFVMLSSILYKCLYSVCDCLSAQCSCPVYP